MNETIWNAACYQHYKFFETSYHYSIRINAILHDISKVGLEKRRENVNEKLAGAAGSTMDGHSKTWRVIGDFKNNWQRSWFPFIHAKILELKSTIVHYVILWLCLSTTHLASVVSVRHWNLWTNWTIICFSSSGHTLPLSLSRALQ